MLAVRDQENLVHAHQTTAAGKTLNQGIRSLQPKTPGNLKTPFRPSKNDENKPFAFNGPKTAGKGGDGKLDKSAFVTPMGPRIRAPLGMKTTNAKGLALKTPGPLQMTVKPERTNRRPSTARKSEKSKLKIAPAQPVETEVLEAEDDDDVPEIEYAPPSPIELPDPPMEFGYDQSFPQFQGMNMMRGYGELYGSPKDESGKSLRVKREEEIYEQFTREMERKLLKSMEEDTNPLEEDAKLELQVEAMIAAGPRRRRAEDSKVDTIKARSAAAVLSQSSLPLVATKETASSLQKRRRPAFAVLGSKPALEPTNPSPMRHTAAAVVSKNTIGYPKARKPRSIIPNIEQRSSGNQKPTQPTKIDQSKIHPKDFVELYGEPPVESDMWFRLREHELLDDRLKSEGKDLADDLFETDFFPVGAEDDDELFQLPLPE